MKITMKQAREWYRIGNSDGRGFAPADVTGKDARTVDAAVGCAIAMGDTLLLARDTSDDVALLRSSSDGGLFAIGGDASGNQPWAVDVTRYMTAETL